MCYVASNCQGISAGLAQGRCGAGIPRIQRHGGASIVGPTVGTFPLSFLKGDGCLLLVAAGDARIDNTRFKAAFGCKAKMPERERVEVLTGHPVGGVCPFANPEEVAVYLDESLRRFATVFPACGSANSAIELTCEELETLSRAAGWVDVCKGWQVENA